MLAALCFGAGLVLADLAPALAGGPDAPALAGGADAPALACGPDAPASSPVAAGPIPASPAVLFALSAASTFVLLGVAMRARATTLSLSALPLIAFQGLMAGIGGDHDASPAAGLHLKPAVCMGTIIGPPQERSGRIRCVVKPEWILVDSVRHASGAPMLATIVYRSRDALRPVLRYGDRLALCGILLLPSAPRNPGEMDRRTWYRANGYSHDLLVRGAGCVRVLGKGDVPALSRHIVEPARVASVAAIDAGYNGQAGEFLKGLLLGLREGIDQDTQEAFVNAGVSHILAVSGSNVAVVAAIVLFLLGLARFPVRHAAVPLATVLVLYMLVTGSQPPVVRATLMAMLVLGGRIVQRKANGLNVVGVAALLALIDAPRLHLDAGFLLSFSAVLSLVVAYPALDRRILALRAPGPIRAPLVWTLRLAGMSLIATLGTLPLTALSFGRLSIIGILANIPVVPLSGAAVVLGAASMLCRWFAPVLAPGFEAVNMLILDLTLWIARAAGGLPWAWVDTSSWTILEIVPLLAGAGAWLFPGGGRARRALLLTALTAVTVLVITARPTLLARPARTLTVSVIDVGQGDAILLQFPDDVSMLIDAGPRSPAFDSGRKVVAPLLGRFGVDRLTYLVLTHPHNDHVGGVGGVLRSVQADTVLASTWIDPGGRAIPFRQLAAGASFSPTTDSRVYVLWPDTPRPPGGRSPFATANNRSLILKVVYGGFSILLTGDGEAAVERPIADRYGVFIRSTVLKVGHHGSSSSSSERFLRQVRPELAVISVGTLNSFGHPSTEVLGRLAALPCDVRRTDREGCVMIRTDGRTWERVVWRD